MCFINDTSKFTVRISLVFYRHIMHAFIFVIVILSEMISHCIQRYLSISLIHILIFWKIALFIGNIINYFYNLYLSGNNMLYHVFQNCITIYFAQEYCITIYFAQDTVVPIDKNICPIRGNCFCLQNSIICLYCIVNNLVDNLNYLYINYMK